MIVLNNAKPLPEGEAVAPTSYSSLLGRRLSTNTTSPPPPYEATKTDTPSLVPEEKHQRRENHNKSRHRKERRHELKPAYKEPPPEFSRVAAVSLQALNPFDPLTVLVGGSGRALDKGLSVELPPSIEEPHPFTQRDISMAEWQRFMQDLRDGTAISDRTKHKTLLIPLALGLGPGAFFVSRAVKAKIRRKKLAYAINLINTWNQYFFAPRGVEVILMRGDRSLTTGATFHPVTQTNLTHQDNPSSASLSSHSSSSSSRSSSGEKEENSIGCCNQPRTPMRLVVVPI